MTQEQFCFNYIKASARIGKRFGFKISILAKWIMNNCLCFSLVSYPTRLSFSFILGLLQRSSVFPTSRENRNIVQLCCFSLASWKLLNSTDMRTAAVRILILNWISLKRVTIATFASNGRHLLDGWHKPIWYLHKFKVIHWANSIITIVIIKNFV